MGSENRFHSFGFLAALTTTAFLVAFADLAADFADLVDFFATDLAILLLLVAKQRKVVSKEY